MIWKHSIKIMRFHLNELKYLFSCFLSPIILFLFLSLFFFLLSSFTFFSSIHIMWGLQRWKYFNVLVVRGLQESSWKEKGIEKEAEIFIGCWLAGPLPSSGYTFRGDDDCLSGHQTWGMRPHAPANKEASAVKLQVRALN